MRYLIRLTFSFCLILFLSLNGKGQSDKMAFVKGGSYVPFFGEKGKSVVVKSFLMDVYPVANKEYIQFVIKYPEWKKSKAKKLFADDSYLRFWKNDTSLPYGLSEKSPITNVSWFAANAYCECQGKRLPTVDEWEYASMANQTSIDARVLKSYNQYILDWYERPKTYTNEVGKTFKNYWGIYDLHGLVWEWTLDFNSVLLSGESRKDVDKDRNQFCGSASINASDLMNYASFMRYSFRGSLKAKYSVRNLGFRCVKDISKP